VARFEPSTLPKYAGRRVVHIRFVKILNPVTCMVDVEKYKGRIMRPVEGDFFTVSPHGGGPPRPWAYDIDRNKGKFATALRALWDISIAP
jgi:hypothetical protein